MTGIPSPFILSKNIWEQGRLKIQVNRTTSRRILHNCNGNLGTSILLFGQHTKGLGGSEANSAPDTQENFGGSNQIVERCHLGQFRSG
ncbi:hypothetical protein DdX_12771 [Ditylenchus destructor]|uniref:Uncharacterized protein n=1 Tax=Ditylenchus destructor TaxID=166010 RepID=A0AAD4R3C4_9BILA|nr:hypothetical protein DdX_12771 [Ditylenchus destructor]